MSTKTLFSLLLVFLVFATLFFPNQTEARSRQFYSAEHYSRKKFKHWIDEDRNCRNTRQEILIKKSLVPVTFTNSKKGDCTVKSGKWKDFYYDEILEKSNQVDIDHVVSLKHAWDIGASSWTNQQRQAFANDPENLVVTNLKYNRQKGAKTILEWMPINRTYACIYVARWFRVKEKYHLPISKEEQENKELLKCPNQES